MFRPGADVEIKGGQAVLTPRGRAEFAVWRYTLSAVALGSFVSIIVLLFLAMRFPARLGNRVLDLVHTRVQADADAKIQVAGQRKTIIVAVAKKVDASDDSQDGKLLRFRNLQRMMNQQNMIMSEARKPVEVDEDFEPLTYIQAPTTGHRTPVNATKDGHFDPEVVKAFMANNQELSALMRAVNEEALGRIKPNAAERVQHDLALKLREAKP